MDQTLTVDNGWLILPVSSIKNFFIWWEEFLGRLLGSDRRKCGCSLRKQSTFRDVITGLSMK